MRKMSEDGSKIGMSRRAFIEMGGMLFATCLLGGCSSAGKSSDNHTVTVGGKQNSTAASVSPKSSVEDYTWDELSAISDEISASGSEDAALQVAEKYNLCSSDGKLDGTQAKSLTLSDGTQTSVHIAGFYHDDRSDGSGKAGITFIFGDAVAERAMNSGYSNSGGWEASEMRSWLASDFMAMLPADLSNDIVTVDKLTNNTGATTDTSSVTATQDAIWLFSNVELCGGVSWYDTAYNAVLNAEGTEYQLFSDCRVDSGTGNAILSQIEWMRSPDPSDKGLFCFVAGARPLGHDYAPTIMSIVPGFCI